MPGGVTQQILTNFEAISLRLEIASIVNASLARGDGLMRPPERQLHLHLFELMCGSVIYPMVYNADPNGANGKQAKLLRETSLTDLAKMKNGTLPF